MLVNNKNANYKQTVERRQGVKNYSNYNNYYNWHKNSDRVYKKKRNESEQKKSYIISN
jgi:hypothetical protein